MAGRNAGITSSVTGIECSEHCREDIRQALTTAAGCTWQAEPPDVPDVASWHD